MFDIIYRHRGPLTRQVEDGVSKNLGIEKGNIQDGRDEIKNIVLWGTFCPDASLNCYPTLYFYNAYYLCTSHSLNSYENYTKILTINRSLFPNKVFFISVGCLYL